MIHQRQEIFNNSYVNSEKTIWNRSETRVYTDVSVHSSTWSDTESRSHHRSKRLVCCLIWSAKYHHPSGRESVRYVVDPYVLPVQERFPGWVLAAQKLSSKCIHFKLMLILYKFPKWIFKFVLTVSAHVHRWFQNISLVLLFHLRNMFFVMYPPDHLKSVLRVCSVFSKRPLSMSMENVLRECPPTRPQHRGHLPVALITGTWSPPPEPPPPRHKTRPTGCHII